MFMTSVEISIVQVGVLLRLCFEPTITYVALSKITGGTVGSCDRQESF